MAVSLSHLPGRGPTGSPPHEAQAELKPACRSRVEYPVCLLGDCRRPAYFKPLRGLLRASPFFLQTDGAVTEECIRTIHIDPCGSGGKARTMQQFGFLVPET